MLQRQTVRLTLVACAALTSSCAGGGVSTNGRPDDAAATPAPAQEIGADAGPGPIGADAGAGPAADARSSGPPDLKVSKEVCGPTPVRLGAWTSKLEEIALDDGTLYLAGERLLRVEPGGREVELWPARVPMAARAGAVYFVASDGIRRTRAGETLSTLLVPGAFSTEQLEIDDRHVYWIEGRNTLMRASLVGGGSETVIVERLFGGDVRLDGDHAYYDLPAPYMPPPPPPSFSEGLPPSLYRVDTRASKPDRELVLQHRPNVAVSAGMLFLWSQEMIVSPSPSGGAQLVLVSKPRNAVSWDVIRSIAFDDRFVYWAELHCGPGGNRCATGALRRVPHRGGPVDHIADLAGTPPWATPTRPKLVIGQRCLYWIEMEGSPDPSTAALHSLAKP